MKRFDDILRAAFEAGRAREAAEVGVEQGWVMADNADEVAPDFEDFREGLSA